MILVHFLTGQWPHFLLFSIATAPTGGTTGVVWWLVPPPLHLLLAAVVGTGYQPVAPPGGLPVVPVVAITLPVRCCWYRVYGTQVLLQGDTKYTNCPYLNQIVSIQGRRSMPHYLCGTISAETGKWYCWVILTCIHDSHRGGFRLHDLVMPLDFCISVTVDFPVLNSEAIAVLEILLSSFSRILIFCSIDKVTHFLLDLSLASILGQRSRPRG